MSRIHWETRGRHVAELADSIELAEHPKRSGRYLPTWAALQAVPDEAEGWISEWRRASTWGPHGQLEICVFEFGTIDSLRLEVAAAVTVTSALNSQWFGAATRIFETDRPDWHPERSKQQTLKVINLCTQRPTYSSLVMAARQ